MLTELFARRASEKYRLNRRHVNPHVINMLEQTGKLTDFVRGKGAMLYDANGDEYFDLHSGSGVFLLGRNHPRIVQVLQEAMALDLPSLSQRDAYLPAGLLAEKLVQYSSHLQRVFFCNSGTEATEGAIKFAKLVTGRDGLVFCEAAFHGLTYGSLSINGDEGLRRGFGTLLPNCFSVPFNDLEALEAILATNEIAAFFVEPIQSSGAVTPEGQYLRHVADLCKQHGTLLIVDEVQSGMGRSGRFLASQHYNTDADMVLLAKALSGGFVPSGAILMREWISDVIFDQPDGRLLHGSTFARNDLAMAAGIAVLSIIDEEQLMDRATLINEIFLNSLEIHCRQGGRLRKIHGKGAMVGLEFASPTDGGCDPKLAVSVSNYLFRRHRIICDTSSSSEGTLIFRPPLITEKTDLIRLVEILDSLLEKSEVLTM
ncbi:aspartate aminotransferase family protein [Agrobacterium sp. 22-226-1]